MTFGINVVAALALLALIAALIALPIFLMVLCVGVFNRSGSTPARIMSGIGIAVCLTPVAAVASYVVAVCPGRSGVLSQGTSPSGQEYCVVQTFKGLVEPYQVSFYIRDTSRVWRWNYLEHEDNAWRSAAVEFTGGNAMVSRNGKPFREIAMPTGIVDIATVSGGYVDYYCPPEFTVEDVLRFHNNKYR